MRRVCMRRACRWGARGLYVETVNKKYKTHRSSVPTIFYYRADYRVVLSWRSCSIPSRRLEASLEEFDPADRRPVTGR